MPKRAPIPTTSIRLKAVVEVVPDIDAKVALQRLKALTSSNGYGMEQLLREVIKDSLYQAYSARYMNYVKSNRLIPVKGEGESRAANKVQALRSIRAAQRRIASLVEQLRSAQLKGRSDRVAGLQEAIKEAEEQQINAQYKFAGFRYEKVSYSTNTRLGTKSGLKRVDTPDEKRLKLVSKSGFGSARANEIYNKLLPKRPERGGGRNDIHLSFGRISVLDRGPLMSDKTKSKMNIMWRQLEFGSGVFAKDQPKIGSQRALSAPRTQGPTKSSAGDGSWYFGNLYLLGTKPGNFLRQVTGLVFPGDIQLFRSTLHQALDSALRGR